MHPEDNRSSSTVSLPSGATSLLTGNTGLADPYISTKYDIIRVANMAGSTLSFTHTITGTNSKLWIRYAVINHNTNSASVVSNYGNSLSGEYTATASIVSGKLYALVCNVDYRSYYTYLFPATVIHYYDMPYATTYFMRYYFSSISVIKAPADMTFTTRKTGNYAHTLINLD